MIATHTSASVPASLLLETAKQAVAFSNGPVGSSIVVQTLAEGVMRSLKIGILKVWLFVGHLGLTLTGGGLMLARGADDPGDQKVEQPKADAKPEAVKA